MSSVPVGVGVAREKVEAAERSSRQLADACFAAWGSMDKDNGALMRTANFVMDCSYIASATARLLSHSDDYQLHAIAMQVAVCRRVSKRIAQISVEQPTAIVLACTDVARRAIASYDDLLSLLRETSRAQPTAVRAPDEPAVEADVDEPVA